jgi:hypothetical protein
LTKLADILLYPVHTSEIFTVGNKRKIILLFQIMNKGPPAGNVLRKQISLLPKYQLVATPIDAMSVSVKLILLNQADLAENVEQLTAGDSHNCHIIAGDSENHVLLLVTFK